MSIYSDYLREIEERKGQGLHPKPIDGAELLSEIITQLKTPIVPNHYIFFIYNTVPSTTPAAGAKAVLKEIIQGIAVVNEITPALHLNYYHT
jgi:aconitate hydratase 2/2-methylisocitrate dehydratase